LARGLQALDLRALPSRANFIQFQEPPQAAPGGKGWHDWLLQGGVIVRPLGEGWLRVSVGKPAENVRFLKRLARGLA
jgi:histidinol-phosphate/aromatic aminotransferase/cobyric acid decarboxylase-like protein